MVDLLVLVLCTWFLVLCSLPFALCSLLFALCSLPFAATRIAGPPADRLSSHGVPGCSRRSAQSRSAQPPPSQKSSGQLASLRTVKWSSAALTSTSQPGQLRLR